MIRNEYLCDCVSVDTELVESIMKNRKSEKEYSDLANLYKIFADNTRVKILDALYDHELCVCDICTILSMTKSAISHQLNTLRSAKLVKFRKVGKRALYSLDDDHVKILLQYAYEHISEEA